MSCRELIDFLWRYLEEDLTPEERRTFDEHLAVCPHCVRYLDSYRRTVTLGKEAFAKLPPEASVPVEVPEELVRAILAARDSRMR